MHQNGIDFPRPRNRHSASAKRYLVTGGCGFIGSHLADRLVMLGHEVRILDNLSSGRHVNVAPQVETIIGDIRDERLVRDAMRGVEGCFHLAAVASVSRCNEDPLATHCTNLTGTLNVLRAAAAAGAARLVYASSAAVYGANPDMPLGEASVAAPLSVYGADKLACELHARVATHLHGLSTVGLRLFNIYGARQDAASPYAGVISVFADRIGGECRSRSTATASRCAILSMSTTRSTCSWLRWRRTGAARSCAICARAVAPPFSRWRIYSRTLFTKKSASFSYRFALAICASRSAIRVGEPRSTGVVPGTRLPDGLSRLIGALEPEAAMGFAPELRAGEANR